MNLDYHLRIYNCNVEDIPPAIIRMMRREGFTLVDSELRKQALQDMTDMLPQANDKVMFRRFLVSPKENKWCLVHPTGWYSDFQFYGLELSKELNCTTIVILRDDTSGWGYEIYKNGREVDKYHTDPNTSPRIHERQEYAIEPYDQYLFDFDISLKKEYQGNPDLVARIFDVDENEISRYLRIRENETGSDTHLRLFHFWLELKIPEDDRMYQEIFYEVDENWSHLIFVRQLTPIELKWRARWGEVMPLVPPPLWIKRQS